MPRPSLAWLAALSLAAALPGQTPSLSKEYVRLGGRIIAIENQIAPFAANPADVSAGSGSGVTISCCIVAAADFNNDGVPDLVWQSPSTGAAQIWYMGGSLGATYEGAANVATSNSWRIATAVKYATSGSNAYLVWVLI